MELDDCSSVPREFPPFYTEFETMSKVKSDIPIQLTNTTRAYNTTIHLKMHLMKTNTG